MVFRAAEYDRLEFMVLGDSGDTGPGFGLEFFARTSFPFFRAEAYVDARARVGVRPSAERSAKLGHPSRGST
jgi:hypothetical protein